MTQNEICPNCRSTFEINGALDFGAPALQAINCPVCGQQIWEASGLWPQQWTVGQVISAQTNYPPPTVVTAPTGPDTQPVFSNLTLPGGNLFNQVGQTFNNVGIWAVVVLVLVLLIMMKWKE